MTFPVLSCTALDARDCRGLAEFYRELLGLHYRAGDEPPADGSGIDGAPSDGAPADGPAPDDSDWLVLLDDQDRRVLAVQEKTDLRPSTWPSEEIPMQLHMDFRVRDAEELARHRRRAEALGARLLMDRSADPDEPLFVMGDPEGHPFCLLVG
ncbi:VOC family protein [Brachybacterium sp. ACRRE]|uniref:VOC family protein n=1 Tax=Brachybacterium sp. ACRRE TaxID=2918184 RepID=UPI001EF361C2|nr:VOC family protein [Brachybacterium sp. ACRRE]MCG7311115.1 VOC family protein [Brachybacterium sp. ACRRE]